jgi:hypothetical protein
MSHRPKSPYILPSYSSFTDFSTESKVLLDPSSSFDITSYTAIDFNFNPLLFNSSSPVSVGVYNQYSANLIPNSNSIESYSSHEGHPLCSATVNDHSFTREDNELPKAYISETYQSINDESTSCRTDLFQSPVCTSAHPYMQAPLSLLGWSSLDLDHA